MKNEAIVNNIEKAVKLIEQQKQEIKSKKDARLKAETRIEENEKGLNKDYEEVRNMGFDPEKIDEAIAQLDETLERYNKEILEYIEKLEAKN